MQSIEKNSGRVLIVGAGLMGHSIAQLFAAQKYQVTLTDVSDEALSRALVEIRRGLTFMAKQGLVKECDIEPALERIQVTTSLEDAVSGVQFVVEAVSESLALKRQVFSRLDSLCPATVVLATNTSVISVTEIAEECSCKDRVVGTHFWNPPTLVPLVEIVPGKHTSPEVVEKTVSLMMSVGKHPVRIKRDVPGFVGNRLQHALWREAISIVEHGIADPDVVDEVVKYGFGLRLPVLGPIENAELVGLDLTLAVHDYLFKHLEHSDRPSPLLLAKVEKGDLGFKSGRGFREWDARGINRVRTDLEMQLVTWLKQH